MQLVRSACVCTLYSCKEREKTRRMKRTTTATYRKQQKIVYIRRSASTTPSTVPETHALHCTCIMHRCRCASADAMEYSVATNNFFSSVLLLRSAMKRRRNDLLVGLVSGAHFHNITNTHTAQHTAFYGKYFFFFCILVQLFVRQNSGLLCACVGVSSAECIAGDAKPKKKKLSAANVGEEHAFVVETRQQNKIRAFSRTPL